MTHSEVDEKQIRIRNHRIGINQTLLDALRTMDRIESKLLIVEKDGKFESLVSIGDVQRAILAAKPMHTLIEEITRPNISVAHRSQSLDTIRENMLTRRTEFMPVVDNDGCLVDVLFWDELFTQIRPSQQAMELPVVIMAGGRGERLRPISNILPKPLFPIGQKTILETIIDRFFKIGCRTFHASVNYRAEMIEAYLEEVSSQDYKIKMHREAEPSGTAGSLRMMRDELQETFFVSNCDILIDGDYREIVRKHHAENNQLTVVAAVRETFIPYGTLEINEFGSLHAMNEKPSYTHLVNAGMYVVEPSVIGMIPEGKMYHMTDLVEEVMRGGGSVGVYPIAEENWSDIGQWSEYRRTLAEFDPTGGSSNNDF